MSKYSCSVDNYVTLELSIDHDRDITLEVYDEYSGQILYLDKLSAQKLANELNQLLMEGYGNE